MVIERKKRILAEVTTREPGSEFETHNKYYVSRMDASTIRELMEKPDQVISYRFFVCNTKYYPEIGSEETTDYTYMGPRVYFGRILSVKEAAFIFGVEYDRINGIKPTDVLKIAGEIVSYDNRQVVQRFCVSGNGENQVVSPMYVTDVSYDEYILMLSKFHDEIERQEEGVDRVCSSKVKGKE